jgi:carbonic anhydrase
MCDRCNRPILLSRRTIIAASMATLCSNMMPPYAFAQSAGAAPNAISPDEALKRVMDGNARYAANAPANKDFSVGRATRASAQYPIAAILSCADSRVAPELAFDQGPGDLFVVRVAGNFVNDDGLASLEYGVRFLGTPLVMVLGHSGCGALDAAIKVLKDGIELPGHLPQLVNSIKPAVEVAKRKNPGDLLAEATVENVRLNMRRLASAEPIVSALVKDGKVKVVGGVYDIRSGQVNLV